MGYRVDLARLLNAQENAAIWIHVYQRLKTTWIMRVVTMTGILTRDVLSNYSFLDVEVSG